MLFDKHVITSYSIHYTKLYEVDVGAIGDSHAQTPGSQELLLLDRPGGVYKKLVTDAEGKTLLRAIRNNFV